MLPCFSVSNFYNPAAVLLPAPHINSNFLFVLIFFRLYHNVHALLNFPDTSQPKKNNFFSKLSEQWSFQSWNTAQRSFPSSVKYCPSSVGLRGNTERAVELSQQQSSASVVAPGFLPFQKKQSVLALCLAPAVFPSLPPDCLGVRGVPNQNSSAPLPSPPAPHPSVWEWGGPLLGPAAPAAKVREERENSHSQTLPQVRNSHTHYSDWAGSDPWQNNFRSICDFSCIVM